jgi:hypothetical protein
MYLRIYSCVLAFGVLTACEATQTPEPEGDAIDCAIGAGAEFSKHCTLEWIGDAQGQEFLIHHPDGGFRRFTLSQDAGSIALKDGAEELEIVEPSPQGFWQFSVAGDRYLVPFPPPSGV